MNGKDKCRILKQIRRDVAEKNDISLTIAECNHKGDCAGTCPRCEAEVAALEKALADRKKQKMQVVIAGISAGIVAAGCASCEPISGKMHELEGDVPYTETTQEEAVTLEGDIRAPETEQETEIDGEIAVSETADELRGRTAGVIAMPEVGEK